MRIFSQTLHRLNPFRFLFIFLWLDTLRHDDGLGITKAHGDDDDIDITEAHGDDNDLDIRKVY